MAPTVDHPGHRQVDLAEQDDQHHAGGDDAEEGGDLELLQQVFGRQEVRRIEAADEQQQRRCSRTAVATAGSTRGRSAGSMARRSADGGCRSSLMRTSPSRLRTRNRRDAPRLTASSSTTPWNSGCHSGSKSNTNSRSPIVRKASAPKMAPMALPRAAEQRHAAEHHRGDRVQRVGVAVGAGRLARIGEEGEEQPADRREHARPACRRRTSPAGSARPTCRRRPRTSRRHRRRGR